MPQRAQPDPAGASTRRLRVARGEGTGAVQYHAYDVPQTRRTTVLDGLLHIQRHLDRTLIFRYACRAAMCGTCGVRVNGVERLACSTRLSVVPGRDVVVEPLRHLPLIRDLMVDFAPFFDAWRAVKPSFMPTPALQATSEHTPGPAAIAPDSRERRIIDRHRECISCGICFSACDMVSLSPGFLGPAAINRSFCLITDSRDRGRDERLDVLNRESGCWRCHTHTTCSELCPKGLDPTLAIEEVKRILAARTLQKALRGHR
ncbi:MAG: succinate dehydrogenase/fumarate reductase iron-sulfur subunit [bacterium]